ncbi:MAG: hypothetical protein H7318_16110 [Oligoflexus sp.]|nr:hypothetical protein [Oligoflexus sp.]
MNVRFILILHVYGLLGCKTLGNRYDDTILRCGKLENGVQIPLEIWDADEQVKIDASQIDVFKVNDKPERVRSSPKGCVYAPAKSRIIIGSNTKGSSAVIETKSEGLQKIRLQRTPPVEIESVNCSSQSINLKHQEVPTNSYTIRVESDYGKSIILQINKSMIEATVEPRAMGFRDGDQTMMLSIESPLGSKAKVITCRINVDSFALEPALPDGKEVSYISPQKPLKLLTQGDVVTFYALTDIDDNHETSCSQIRKLGNLVPRDGLYLNQAGTFKLLACSIDLAGNESIIRSFTIHSSITTPDLDLKWVGASDFTPIPIDFYSMNSFSITAPRSLTADEAEDECDVRMTNQNGSIEKNLEIICTSESCKDKSLATFQSCPNGIDFRINSGISNFSDNKLIQSTFIRNSRNGLKRESRVSQLVVSMKPHFVNSSDVLFTRNAETYRANNRGEWEKFWNLNWLSTTSVLTEQTEPAINLSLGKWENDLHYDESKVCLNSGSKPTCKSEDFVDITKAIRLNERIYVADGSTLIEFDEHLEKKQAYKFSEEILDLKINESHLDVLTRRQISRLRDGNLELVRKLSTEPMSFVEGTSCLLFETMLECDGSSYIPPDGFQPTRAVQWKSKLAIIGFATYGDARSLYPAIIFFKAGKWSLPLPLPNDHSYTELWTDRENNLWFKFIGGFGYYQDQDLEKMPFDSLFKVGRSFISAKSGEYLTLHSSKDILFLSTNGIEHFDLSKKGDVLKISGETLSSLRIYTSKNVLKLDSIKGLTEILTEPVNIQQVFSSDGHVYLVSNDRSIYITTDDTLKLVTKLGGTDRLEPFGSGMNIISAEGSVKTISGEVVISKACTQVFTDATALGFNWYESIKNGKRFILNQGTCSSFQVNLDSEIGYKSEESILIGDILYDSQMSKLIQIMPNEKILETNSKSVVIQRNERKLSLLNRKSGSITNYDFLAPVCVGSCLFYWQANYFLVLEKDRFSWINLSDLSHDQSTINEGTLNLGKPIIRERKIYLNGRNSVITFDLKSRIQSKIALRDESDRIIDLIEDSKNNLWVLSEQGVSVLRK